MLREMLERHEGRKEKKYKCSSGKWTIGVGHNIEAKGLPPDIEDFLEEYEYITDEMIDRLLDIDVEDAITDCEKLYPNFGLFSDVRQYALIDLMFNMGLVRMKKFKNTNKAINDERWEDAARLLMKSLYWRQLGGDPEGTDDGKLERPEEIANMLREG